MSTEEGPHMTAPSDREGTDTARIQKTYELRGECPGCGKAYPEECDWCSDTIPKPALTSRPAQPTAAPIPVNMPTCGHGKGFLQYCPECESSRRWGPECNEPQQPEDTAPPSPAPTEIEEIRKRQEERQKNTYGNLDNGYAEDAHNDCATLLPAYDSLIEENARLTEELAEAQSTIIGMRRTISEAGNTGDGSYSP